MERTFGLPSFRVLHPVDPLNPEGTNQQEQDRESFRAQFARTLRTCTVFRHGHGTGVNTARVITCSDR